MGCTSRNSRARATRRLAAVGVVAAVVGLASCAGGDDDDDAAVADTEAAADVAPAATAAQPADEDTGYGVVGRAGSGEAAPEAPAPAGGGIEAAAQQPVGQQIAIEAHATMQADDVKAAVDRITTTVAARGGRIAAADIDYAPPTDGADGAEPAGSRATLVVAIPPGELGAVRGVLEDAGDVLSYDQLAEDVTDQLADLDSRIANQRASVERIRELYVNAADVDAIVRIEAELTSRETVLEQMLAAQQALTDRVAMSTLTIDITASPAAAEATVEDDDTTLGDALAGGWSAFAGGAFAIVLALTAAMPFILALLLAGVVFLWVRARVRRSPPPDHSTPEPRREDVTASASRPE